MKYKFAWKKGNVVKLRVILDDGKEQWADTTEAVYNYARKLFGNDEIPNGIDCGFEYTEKDGQYNITRIIKEGTSTKTETPPTAKYACEDCGKELKDDKYKKCYLCNKKNPAPKQTTTGGSKSSYGNPTPEEAKRRSKLAVLSAVATAMPTMAGQIGNIDSFIEALKTAYTELHKHLFGE